MLNTMKVNSRLLRPKHVLEIIDEHGKYIDNINKDAAIIQVELEPTALGRYFPIALGIWADAPTAAQQLCDALANLQARAAVEAWTETLKSDRAAYLAQRDADADSASHPIQPSGLFKELRAALPENAAITMDAGTLCLQATDALNYHQPSSTLVAESQLGDVATLSRSAVAKHRCQHRREVFERNV